MSREELLLLHHKLTRLLDSILEDTHQNLKKISLERLQCEKISIYSRMIVRGIHELTNYTGCVWNFENCIIDCF
jgi:hypothetical protein